jgi:hypothetical protein
MPMHAQHGLRRDEEDLPSRSWQQPGQGCQWQPVPALVSRPRYLPAQHRQLVPQDQDLDLLLASQRPSRTASSSSRRTTRYTTDKITGDRLEQGRSQVNPRVQRFRAHKLPRGYAEFGPLAEHLR